MADKSFAVYFFHPVILIQRHRRPAEFRAAPPRQVRGGGGGGGADLLCGGRDGAEADTVSVLAFHNAVFFRRSTIIISKLLS